MKNLSPRAKKILMVLAQDEARKIGSTQLLPEHVVLAILKSKDGLGYSAISELGLDPSMMNGMGGLGGAPGAGGLDPSALKGMDMKKLMEMAKKFR